MEGELEGSTPLAVYCDATDVMFWLYMHMKGAPIPIDNVTEPGLTMFNKAIRNAQTQVNQRLASAGFIIPLAPIEEGGWYHELNEYLRLVTAVGAATFLMTSVISPFPGGFGTSSDDNPQMPGVVDLYKIELNRIYDRNANRKHQHQAAFRAKYKPNTAAHYALGDPSGPVASFRYEGADDDYSPTLYFLAQLRQHLSDVVTEDMISTWVKSMEERKFVDA